mgnify:CR=1 FL=1
MFIVSQLPYYIDGDIKITETSAITRYIARKYNLEPKTEVKRIRMDMGQSIISEIRDNIGRIAYSKDYVGI